MTGEIKMDAFKGYNMFTNVEREINISIDSVDVYRNMKDFVIKYNLLPNIKVNYDGNKSVVYGLSYLNTIIGAANAFLELSNFNFYFRMIASGILPDAKFKLAPMDIASSVMNDSKWLTLMDDYSFKDNFTCMSLAIATAYYCTMQ